MKTRLKDIADATGFSVNTVSHALRDESDISEATKAIIRRVADELDYIPNFQARGVRAGKSSIISVILPDIINPHFSIVFRGIEQYFRAFGITPLFMNTAENADDELRAVKVSIGQNVDGVIICPTQANTDSIRYLEKSRIPYVLIGRHFDGDPDTDYVVCDDAGGAYLATRHLIEQGHRNIACVRVNPLISSDRERFAGYRRALEEAEIPFSEENILNLPLAQTEYRTEISGFLSRNRTCTAILSFNDMLAYGIIREARQAGLRVPEDISVIGFDNICADYIFPTMLSSVSVSKKTMAHIASETLYNYISGKAEFGAGARTHIVLPTGLYLRDTTATRK